MDQPTDVPANRRGKATPAALAVAALLAAAVPALAADSSRPPKFTASNRGAQMRATIGDYFWCVGSGQGSQCSYRNNQPEPHGKRSIPARPGDRIVLRPHHRATTIAVHVYKGLAYRNQPKPTDDTGRVWKLKIAKGMGKRLALVANVQYGQGNGADFGFAIRRASK